MRGELVFRKEVVMKQKLVKDYLEDVSNLVHRRERSGIRNWKSVQRPFVSGRDNNPNLDHSNLEEHPHLKEHLRKDKFYSEESLLLTRGRTLIAGMKKELEQILDKFDDEARWAIEDIMLLDNEKAVILGDTGDKDYPKLSTVVDNLMYFNKQLLAARKEQLRQSETVKGVLPPAPRDKSVELMEEVQKHEALVPAKRPVSPASPPLRAEKLPRIEENNAQGKKTPPPPPLSRTAHTEKITPLKVKVPAPPPPLQVGKVNAQGKKTPLPPPLRIQRKPPAPPALSSRTEDIRVKGKPPPPPPRNR